MFLAKSFFGIKQLNRKENVERLQEVWKMLTKSFKPTYKTLWSSLFSELTIIVSNIQNTISSRNKLKGFMLHNICWHCYNYKKCLTSLTYLLHLDIAFPLKPQMCLLHLSKKWGGYCVGQLHSRFYWCCQFAIYIDVKTNCKSWTVSTTIYINFKIKAPLLKNYLSAFNHIQMLNNNICATETARTTIIRCWQIRSIVPLVSEVDLLLQPIYICNNWDVALLFGTTLYCITFSRAIIWENIVQLIRSVGPHTQYFEHFHFGFPAISIQNTVRSENCAAKNAPFYAWLVCNTNKLVQDHFLSLCKPRKTMIAYSEIGWDSHLYCRIRMKTTLGLRHNLELEIQWNKSSSSRSSLTHKLQIFHFAYWNTINLTVPSMHYIQPGDLSRRIADHIEIPRREIKCVTHDLQYKLQLFVKSHLSWKRFLSEL